MSVTYELAQVAAEHNDVNRVHRWLGQGPSQDERDGVFQKAVAYRQPETMRLLAPHASRAVVNRAWVEVGNASRFSLWEVLWDHADRNTEHATALRLAMTYEEFAWVDRLLPKTRPEDVALWDPACLVDAVRANHPALVALLIEAKVGSPNQMGAHPWRVALAEGHEAVLPVLRPHVEMRRALLGVLREPEAGPPFTPLEALPEVASPNLAVLDRLVTELPPEERAPWLARFEGALPQALAAQRAATLTQVAPAVGRRRARA